MEVMRGSVLAAAAVVLGGVTMGEMEVTEVLEVGQERAESRHQDQVLMEQMECLERSVPTQS